MEAQAFMGTSGVISLPSSYSAIFQRTALKSSFTSFDFVVVLVFILFICLFGWLEGFCFVLFFGLKEQNPTFDKL